MCVLCCHDLLSVCSLVSRAPGVADYSSNNTFPVFEPKLHRSLALPKPNPINKPVQLSHQTLSRI
jgi:hypothetical protein